MLRIVGGLLSCWRQAARRRGSTQKKKLCTSCIYLVGRMKKEDERRKMEEMHQERVNQMIRSAEGSAGLLHKITKPTAWRGGAQISKKKKKKEEDVRLLDRCEAKRKEKNWKDIDSVTKVCSLSRTSHGTIEELKNWWKRCQGEKRVN